MYNTIHLYYTFICISLCLMYLKIGETYYNLRQQTVTNCVDRRLLQNAATLITNA